NEINYSMYVHLRSTKFFVNATKILKNRKESDIYMELKEVLTKLKNNEISVEEAEKYLRKQPFEEMGYAKLDTHRIIYFI
ncbi:Ncair mutase, partial [human gut metagenome]